MGVAYKFRTRFSPRYQTGLNYALGISTLGLLAVSAYEIPIRLTYADYITNKQTTTPAIK